MSTQTHQPPSDRCRRRATPDRREVVVALTVDRELPLEPTYRLALRVEALLDPRRSAKNVAREAGVNTGQVRLARDIVFRRRRRLVAETLERAERTRTRILTVADPEYPGVLHELELPPACLFCRGWASSATLSAPAIGIVGPRNADPYGLEAARHFAGELADAGLVVTSGFARGIDATAHEEAARRGRPTVAILGCAVDVPYPRTNQPLIEPILDGGGLVVSEFAFGTPPAGWRFPIRNRLIAALSLGMLVIQASLRSGSLISARLALEMGREVYAVPGRIFDARCRGTNRLLQDGAHPALDARSILDTLPLAIREALLAGALGQADLRRRRRILNALAEGNEPAERLSLLLDEPLGEILGALTGMELEGMVRRLPGGRYQSLETRTPTAADRPS